MPLKNIFVQKEKLTKIFFTTDIHGSERCWRKVVNAGAFYNVDEVILGGDIVGNGVQVIVQERPNVWQTFLLGEKIQVEGTSAYTDLVNKIRGLGLYPHCASPDEVAEFNTSPETQERIFRELVTQSLAHWLEIAETKLKPLGRRLIVTPGNTDPLFIDPIFKQCSVITWADHQIIWLDDTHELISEGTSNPTPWQTPREMPEDKLFEDLRQQIKEIQNVYRAVFNLHVPPHDTMIDNATLENEHLLKEGETMIGGRDNPVGSTAVRRIIETYQPLLSLHGHVHGAGGSTRLGRTLCLNPGSTYAEGILLGYLIILDKKGLRAFQPVQG
jgi:uncharacterized protein